PGGCFPRDRVAREHGGAAAGHEEEVAARAGARAERVEAEVVAERHVHPAARQLRGDHVARKLSRRGDGESEGRLRKYQAVQERARRARLTERLLEGDGWHDQLEGVAAGGDDHVRRKERGDSDGRALSGRDPESVPLRETRRHFARSERE